MKPTLVEERVVSLLKERNFKITTMESCTAGLLICALTDIEGSSSITEGGYVTYSNQAKIDQGVPQLFISKFGVYSIKTAISMACSCKAKRKADIGIGVTGTFSNVDPNNPDSKSGEVHFAIDYPGGIYNETLYLPIEFTNSSDKPFRRVQKEYVVTHILNKLEDILLNGI